MGTTAQKLQAILDSKADIASAIEEKGGTAPATFAEYGDAIRALPSYDQEPADVEFIDFDGTVLYKYTYAEAKALTSLPPLPTSHESDTIPLTAQGWNYTLQQIKDNLDFARGGISESDVKAYLGLNDNATLDDVKQELGLPDDSLFDDVLDAIPELFVVKTTVGCNHITSDGATYVTVEVTDDSDRTFNLAFSQTTGNSVRLEWGDGSENNPVGAMAYTVRPHQYSSAGTYTIRISQLASGDPTLKLSGPICGTQTVGSTNIRTGTGLIKSIRLGKVSELSGGVFSNCPTLEAVNIPSGVSLGSNVFTGCAVLKGVVIPSGDQTIGDNSFSYCPHLSKVSIPTSVTTLGANAFKACGMTCVCLTPNVASMRDYAFAQCDSLRYVYGGLSPSGTYGVSLFRYSSDLEKVQVFDGVSLGGGSFNGCTSLREAVFDIVNLGGNTQNFFYECAALRKVGVIMAPTVIQGSFGYCKSLEKVEFADSGTAITFGNKVFVYSAIRVFDFSRCTAIPTITSSTFDNTAADKKIVVPASLLSAWKAAQYWSDIASNIVSA